MDLSSMIDRGPERARRPIAVVGIAAWSVIGVVIVAIGVLLVLAAISELVLPSVFAAMLSVAAYPLARWLGARGLGRSAAASVVLLGILVVTVAVALLVVESVVQQTSSVAREVDAALDELAPTTEPIGLDEEALASLRSSVRSLSGMIGRGLLTALVGGIEATVGFIGGLVLALLIAYYLLADGPAMRAGLLARVPEARRADAAAFVASTIRTTRSYWSGRVLLSAIVAALVTGAGAAMGLPLLGTLAVVTFVGGFIPYVGAFVGGALAALLALGEGGVGAALVMLLVVVAGNVLLENLLEPRILGDRMSLHPLAVLCATTIGGIAGGIVGLMLAVPLTVILRDLLARYGWFGGSTGPGGPDAPVRSSA